MAGTTANLKDRVEGCQIKRATANSYLRLHRVFRS
jgi:hypothetical protein